MSEIEASELLKFNGQSASFRVVDELTGLPTSTFMVVADYGSSERILCSGCCKRYADAIAAACNEAVARAVSENV